MVTIVSMVIYLTPLDRFILGSKWSMLISTIILTCLLIVLFQSLFVIIHYTVDKRLKMLFEAVLDKEGE